MTPMDAIGYSVAVFLVVLSVCMAGIVAVAIRDFWSKK
jgi:hypothetical protein